MSAEASDLVAEGARIMTICNACRYCEGYCAVFPAMERRLTFGAADLSYLANLCHNCGACLPACQYAPPHEFAVNVPQTLAKIRAETYGRYARPAAFAGAFEKGARFTALATVLAVAVFVAATFAIATPAVVLAAHTGEGAFYEVVSHAAMVGLFLLAALYVLAVLTAGFFAFWRDVGETPAALAGGAAWWSGLADALRLKNLGGGGEGCTYPEEERPSALRRVFHHLTFYGFAACFAATCVAAFYDNVLAWRAPYPLLSLPVVLGTVGGIALAIGAAGLLSLIARREDALVDRRQTPMDVAFIVLLILTALTGLALLALRDTAAMGTLLAVHLGIVLALFVTMPYGKFVHGVYRVGALVRSSLEKRRPGPDVRAE